MGFPVFHHGFHPADSLGRLDVTAHNVPINCAGTLVLPGDEVVGDEDGVAVIPQALVPAVVEDVVYHEEREVFLRQLLDAGAPLKGTYPPSEETDRRFRDWRDQMRRDGKPIL